ncbi:MAG: di-trans,poly-cis-decaprenylcistransferase [Bacteroidetes bacterium GWA2_31_9]|nr:MAG: di-trans,poly-cis-decaprenylcistransferase [Bacteroidetes bacterium GWA2_31_9]
MDNIITKIDRQNLPCHVAIIMDGNGRWAKSIGMTRSFGHKNGVNAVREVTEASAELGIKYLTLYAFSTENWNRPKFEINTLMSLLVSSINKEIKTLIKNNIRLLTIGNTESLPKKVQKELSKAIEITSKNSGLTLVLALSYSSRWEIINAINRISSDIRNEVIKDETITEELFTKYLTTSNIPDPDLLIRTSGEYRISNFLLWQIAYSELYFTKKLWPDFNKNDFYEAIFDLQNRERRFGLTSEQIRDK